MANPRWTYDRKEAKLSLGIVGVDEAGRDAWPVRWWPEPLFCPPNSSSRRPTGKRVVE